MLSGKSWPQMPPREVSADDSLKSAAPLGEVPTLTAYSEGSGIPPPPPADMLLPGCQDRSSWRRCKAPTA